jgi:hypothetical protein
MAEHEEFREWAVVELFGHQRLIGMVSEQTVAGQGFLRVDVPETKSQPAFTRLFGPGAIYAINPVSEAIAKLYIERMNQAPIQAYEIRQLMDETR